MRWIRAIGAAGPVLACAALSAQPVPEQTQPLPHTAAWPGLASGESEGMQAASLALGPELERGQSPRVMLAARRRLDGALAALQPQRKGTADVYVVVAALDSDPVFSREAREAGRVLSRRYDAAGRTIVLAGPDGRSAGLPQGSISALTLALARVAELADPSEDVLLLYITSHGAPVGLAYHDGDTGYGILGPLRLRSILGELGLQRRIVLISACYSGVFVPALTGPDTALFTAASASTTSFGCQADNDWTFYGDALVNHALRQPVGLGAAMAQARDSIARWEGAAQLTASEPQTYIGANVASWLTPLEARLPRVNGAPTGVPANAVLAR